VWGTHFLRDCHNKNNNNLNENLMTWQNLQKNLSCICLFNKFSYLRWITDNLWWWDHCINSHLFCCIGQSTCNKGNTIICQESCMVKGNWKYTSTKNFVGRKKILQLKFCFTCVISSHRCRFLIFHYWFNGWASWVYINYGLRIYNIFTKRAFLTYFLQK